jgi:hypothetical protein
MDKQLTLAELEAALIDLGPSPLDHGKVEMIVCRPTFNERQTLDRAEITLAEGLVGDNWSTRGSRHTPDGSANPEVQITIMNSRVIQAITQDRSRWPLAGDQLFIDLDLSADNLPPGQRIAIGTVILEISAVPHTGCAKFTERFGHGAIRFVNDSEGMRQRRRGLNARVIQAGVIGVSDTVSKVK